MANDNTINITVTGNATSANAMLDALANKFGAFNAAAYKAGKEQYDINKRFNDAIAKATEAQQRQTVNAVERSNAEKIKSFNNFFKSANNLSSSSAQIRQQHEVNATNKILAAVNERHRKFIAIEKDLTHQIEKESKKQHTARQAALSTLAHSLPFGIGRTAAFTTMNLGDMSEGSGALGSISAAISKIPVPVVLGLAAAFAAVDKIVNVVSSSITNVLWPAIQHGLQYNDLIENSKLGIAGIVYQMTDLYNGQIKLVTETERWNAALGVSDSITVSLQNASLKTKAVFSDLARSMQEGFAPFLQMGGQQNQLEPFVTRFIHLMATLRIPLREIGQEIRAFANLETNPRTARASFAVIGMMAKEMGITFDEAKAKLQEFKNDNTLIEWFIRNTQGFEKSGLAQMNTLSGIYSNVKEIMDRVLGQGTAQLYEQVKVSLNNLIESLVKFDETGKATFNQGFVTIINLVADALSSVLKVLNLLVTASFKLFENLSKIPTAFNILFKGQQYLNVGGRSVTNPFFDATVFSDLIPKTGKSNPYSFKNDLNTSATNIDYGENVDHHLEAWKFHKKGIKETDDAADKFWTKEFKRREELYKIIEKNAQVDAKFEHDWEDGLRKIADKMEIRLNTWLKIGKEINNISESTAISGIAIQLEETRNKQFKDIVDNLKKTMSADNMRRNADAFNNQVSQFWTGPMSNIFAELGTTGGRNFLEAVASNFDQMVSNAAENFSGIVANFLGFGGKLETGKDEQGNTYYTRNGLKISEAEFNKLNNRQQNVGAALILGNIGFGSYAAGRQNQGGSITAGIIGGGLSGASYGAMMGGAMAPILAVIGAVVGGLTAALGKAEARDQYKYAIPFISDKGVAGLSSVNKNIQAPEQAEILTRLQEQFDKFWNGYIQLAVRFTSGVLPKLTQIWGKFQSEASGHFLKHLDEWINGKLPDIVSVMFKGVLSAGAVAMGMSAKKFEELFNKFSTLDPTKTLELLGILFETLENIQKISKARPADFDWAGKGSAFNIMVGQEGMPKPIWQTFQEADKNILAVAKSLDSLTGEAAIRGAQQLSSLVLNRMGEERRLAQEIAQFLKQSAQQFTDLRQQYTLDATGYMEQDDAGNKTWKPAYEKQVDYLQDYMQTVMNNLSSATNMDQINFWQNEFFKTMQQIGGISQQMGPDAYQKFLDWANNPQSGVISIFQNEIIRKVAELGAAVGEETNKLMTQVQPVLDAFLKTTTDTGTGLGGLIPPIEEVKKAFNSLIQPLNDFKESLINGGEGRGVTNYSASNSSTFVNNVRSRRLANA